LAVAETLMARRHQVRLVVSEKPVDQSALGALTTNSEPSRFGVQTVPAVGCGGPRQWIHFCAGLAKATRDCTALCREFEPEAVLGMGGFTSAPAVLAGRWSKGTRTLIHESNAVPGKANRWTGRVADHIAVGLAECAKFFGTKPVTVTGTPIRTALRQGRVPEARARLGLAPEKVTVLVMGGSQGAHAINEAIACALPWLEDWKEETQFVHLSGSRDETFVRESYEKNGLNATVMSFCGEMELAYSAADFVVSRSGAATLTEIAAFGLPAVLIPYPQAAGDHQLLNARLFEQAGAARVIEQSRLTNGHALAGERLGEVIGGLLADAGQRKKMTVAAQQLAVTDAHERIASLIEQYGD
jgi:UDP-N-acetylglucosamine--N-acetylmuramyl-(pentapeptide) pyrophosphoryl-undecaprenol N-acetylglucosamine transferase